jgi:hypothetical protein
MITTRLKLLCFRFCNSNLLVCGPVCAIMYLVVMGRSSFCVVCVSVCGPVYALVNP